MSSTLVICSYCGGSGYSGPSVNQAYGDEEDTCVFCDGTGKLTEQEYRGYQASLISTEYDIRTTNCSFESCVISGVLIFFLLIAAYAMGLFRDLSLGRIILTILVALVVWLITWLTVSYIGRKIAKSDRTASLRRLK